MVKVWAKEEYVCVSGPTYNFYNKRGWCGVASLLFVIKGTRVGVLLQAFPTILLFFFL
ncbi:hypothetical protein Hanom_Chr11g01032081 [Helianthus anomalus]